VQALRCPRCSSPTVAGQRFCGSCGYALSTDCPRCGTFINPGDRFCENCGISFITGIAPQSVKANEYPSSNQQQSANFSQPFQTQPRYMQASLEQQAQPLAVVTVPKGKFRVAAILLLIASIILIVSPSMVWFRAPFIAAKGSDLGDVSSLLGLLGISLYAKGEYFVVLGVIALILTIVSFFVVKGRKLIAAIIGIAAVICLLLGIEATVKLLDQVTSMGEGIFLMFGSSLLMFIASFKLP
jgi:hypothetical protein